MNDPEKHCYNCAYKRTIPGNAHVKCARLFNGIPQPKRHPQGVKSGWCNWPLNFDPVWVGPCEGFSTLSDSALVRTETPLMKLASLLGGRC